MLYRRCLVLLVAFGLLWGCGGSGGGRSPTSPTPTGQLTINVSSDVICCGKCETFTATVTRGGVTQNVTPAWRTDNTAVATIDAGGQLTAVSNGEVTVIAEFEGLSASKRVRIVANYEGTWYGHYLITRCQASGDFEDLEFCDGEGFAAGQTLPLGLELTQDRERVSGTLWLGQVNGALSGSVSGGGALEGEARITYTVPEGSFFDVLVTPFSVMRQGDRIAEGTFTVTMTSPGARGNGVFDARIMGLDKAPSARSLARMQRPPRTLRDVFRLFRM